MRDDGSLQGRVDTYDAFANLMGPYEKGRTLMRQDSLQNSSFILRVPVEEDIP